jgi:hypothetical protein
VGHIFIQSKGFTDEMVEGQVYRAQHGLVSRAHRTGLHQAATQQLLFRDGKDLDGSEKMERRAALNNKYWDLNDLYGRGYWSVGKREVNRICKGIQRVDCRQIIAHGDRSREVRA